MSQDNNNNNNSGSSDFDWEELLRSLGPLDDEPAEPEHMPMPELIPVEPEEISAPEPILEPEPVAPPLVVPEPVQAIIPEPVVEKPAVPEKKPVEIKIEPETLEPEEEGEHGYEQERDYMPIRPSRVGRVGCLGGMMYAVFVISISIIAACATWMCASDVLALNKDELTATISLPQSSFITKTVDVEDEDGEVIGTEDIVVADIDYVAEQLHDAGIINYPFLFKLYSAVSSADVQIDSGTYELSTDFDYRALVKKMTAGSPSQLLTTLTFPEGYTMEQMFTLLDDNNICSLANLVDTATNYNFNYSFLEEETLGDASRLEGFLFPDTYEFYEGEPAYSVINKMLYNFYYRFTAEMIEKSEAKGLTVRELVTIASMIESEAGSDEDRELIASVIYNRLSQNMPLQIDATIQYVLEERVPVLTVEDTQIDSPYNTYLYTGLPIAPISNPGIASINAAISPASTSYLYYAVNSETGEHEFFTNYNDHQNFVNQQDYSE